MRRFFGNLTCSTMLVIGVLASPVQAQNLELLVGDVLATHPRVIGAERAVMASKATEKEAKAGYLPSVDFNAGAGFEGIDRTGTNPAGNTTQYPTQNASLSMNQPVFRGFAVKAGHESAQVSVDVAEHGLEQTRQQIILEAVSSYINILRQIELNHLSMENIKTLKNQFQLEDEKVQRGSGIAVDVLQAKSRLQIAMERYSAFQGAMMDAKARYRQIFDASADIYSMSLPLIPYGQMPASLEAAIAGALEHNIILQNTAKNVDIAQLARVSARANYYPQVDVNSSFDYNDNAAGISGEDQQYRVTADVSWNLFNGFADRAAIDRAAHNYASASEELRNIIRTTEQDVKLAWSAMVTSKERLELLENAVNIAGEVYDARTRLRDAGSETALNVLDAENELFRAKIDAASVRYDYYISIYSLLQVMGQLKLDAV